MKVTIRVCDLFKGEAIGGLEFGDWLTLNDEGKLKQRLSFISSRANVLIETACSPDSGMPGNIAGDAHLLHQTATRALLAANDRDFLTASGLALDAGRIMAQLNGLMATYAGLKVRAEIQKPRSEGGKATAEIKREEQQKNIEDTVKRWEKLARDCRPERERAGIIAQQTGHPVDTVRRWINKAGLR